MTHGKIKKGKTLQRGKSKALLPRQKVIQNTKRKRWDQHIWEQICMDIICALNKLVFRNKRTSVSRRKPYAIEVLVLR